MRTVTAGLALVSIVWLAFAACSSQSSSGSGAGGALACNATPFTPWDPGGVCEVCVQQNCCSELQACEKQSPFCSWVCAALRQDGPGCEQVKVESDALVACWHSKCDCLCSGRPSLCDAGADGSGGGGGGGGSASSSSGNTSGDSGT